MTGGLLKTQTNKYNRLTCLRRSEVSHKGYDHPLWASSGRSRVQMIPTYLQKSFQQRLRAARAAVQKSEEKAQPQSADHTQFGSSVRVVQSEMIGSRQSCL